jgi:hypothetical protein
MPAPATSAVDQLTRNTLDRVVERSKRRSGLQLPPSFVKDRENFDPPLAKLIRGGHGGEVRLKLYLTMGLLAGQAPHKIRPISGRTWATALGLPDPDVKGARRVADALNWLADNTKEDRNPLVKLERVPGEPPTVQLLSATGSGKVWSRPTQPWVTLPLSYWTEGWIWKLTGSATALLLILLDQQGWQHGRPATFTGQDRQLRGLSDDTWARATAELKTHGLVEVGKATNGENLDWRRARNSYIVLRDHLQDDEDEATTEEPAKAAS